MFGTLFNPSNPAAAGIVDLGDITELVRGPDQYLIDRLSPLVLEQNVSLDLSSVKRIDAAGIAALIVLYRTAKDAGYRFNVMKASSRVTEILNLVGLNNLLLSHNAVSNSQSGASSELPVV